MTRSGPAGVARGVLFAALVLVTGVTAFYLVFYRLADFAGTDPRSDGFGAAGLVLGLAALVAVVVAVVRRSALHGLWVLLGADVLVALVVVAWLT